MSEANGPMNIVVNGEEREVLAPLSLVDLLAQLGIDWRQVAVEKNRMIITKNDFAKTSLAAGDRLEIVTLVGGG